MTPGSFGHMDIVWEDPAAAALILANTTARWVAADNYPIGIPRQVAEALNRRGRAGLRHRGPGRDVCAEPGRRPAVLPLVCEAAADHRQRQHLPVRALRLVPTKPDLLRS
jgi:hypothetical protein